MVHRCRVQHSSAGAHLLALVVHRSSVSPVLCMAVTRRALLDCAASCYAVSQVALDAAEKGDQHALYIKLSNNMGAVLRKQEQHSEVCTWRAALSAAC